MEKLAPILILFAIINTYSQERVINCNRPTKGRIGMCERKICEEFKKSQGPTGEYLIYSTYPIVKVIKGKWESTNKGIVGVELLHFKEVYDTVTSKKVKIKHIADEDSYDSSYCYVSIMGIDTHLYRDRFYSTSKDLKFKHYSNADQNELRKTLKGKCLKIPPEKGVTDTCPWQTVYASSDIDKDGLLEYWYDWMGSHHCAGISVSESPKLGESSNLIYKFCAD